MRVELADLWQKANPGSEAADAGAPGDPFVVVVSSLAGGTGAGLLVTVCDLLRAARLGDELFGILFTSEVFDTLQGPERGGVHANGLAALSEIMNGHWWRGEQIQDPILTRAGAVNPIDRSGPSYPFLVGLRNAANVNFGTFDKLFEATGRALLSWVTAEAGSPNFMSYTIANWATAAGDNHKGRILVNVGPPGEIGDPLFSALGFARLSLGTDHFERYATERLSTELFCHLVDYHRDSDAADGVRRQTQEASPDLLADLLAEQYGQRFRDAAGIVESGTEAGLIRSALLSEDSRSELEAAYRRSVGDDACIEPFAEQRRAARHAPGDWRKIIGQAVEDRFESVSARVRDALDDGSRAWIDEVQERAVAAVEQAIVDYGLRVAQQLCSGAAEYLRATLADGLLHDVVREFRDWAGDWRKHADSSPSGSALLGARGTVAGDDVRLTDYVAEAVHYRSLEIDAIVSERASDLAREAAERLFEPLASASSRAFRRLENQRNRFPEWARWGEEDPPAGECGPPAGEFALIGTTEYYDTFEQLLAQTFPREARRHLREQVIGFGSGSPAGVDVAASWSPTGDYPADPPANVAVTLDFTRESVVQRAEGWLTRPRTPFGDFLALGLRGALSATEGSPESSNQPQGADLLARFGPRLNAAIRAASPLVELSSELAPLVSADGAEAPRLHFSALPFDGQPLQHDLRRVLEAAGVPPDDVTDLFNADPRIRHISITAHLAAPQSVLAIGSLLNPIAGDYARAAADESVDKFWHYRRSRTLRRFVACPQGHLRGDGPGGGLPAGSSG